MIQEFFPSELTSSIINPVRHVIRSLRDQGALIIPVSLPTTSYALSSYYVLASAEAGSNLARYDGIQYGMLTVYSISTGEDLTEDRHKVVMLDHHLVVISRKSQTIMLSHEQKDLEMR